MVGIVKNDYKRFLAEVKERIRQAQYEALKAVNKELIQLYWDIGKMIVEQQKKYSWGKSIVENLAKDLQKEFPGIQGFSAANLWRTRNFYLAYRGNTKLAPLVREISWSKNKDKDRTIVEYVLKDTSKPIGVAIYKITSKLPRNLQKQLPSPEQITKLIENI
ncbi:MAG: DUF1016 N-terminal domain-containing protein [Myxococcota bacterium]